MPELALFTAPDALRAAVADARRSGKHIGLVPTMGNLHDGHLTLVTEARRHCDFVIATIFVNPLQFGPAEDLDKYPRTLAADRAGLQAAGCDALFMPDAATMYPHGLDVHTKISVPQVSTLHCGRTRPGHFDGVCTIVNKLFMMAQPDTAFFGLKDFQQFHIISRMVADLCIPIELHGIPTVREASGLAMSSRNGYLTADERTRAASLYATLRDCAARIERGNHDYAALESEACAMLATAGLRADYVHVCARASLLPAASSDRELVILAAAWAGTTRLIDNILVTAAPL
ncbi:MAG TPA: pantoate--beta-alanine ligase [Pseudomonadales bacterium]